MDAKLPAIKVWEWFDFARVRTQADWFKWGRGRMADFFMRPPTLKAGNFEALWLIDPIFTALKVLNPLKRYFKHQEASYNFKLGFALSNRPHFNSVYLVRVPFLTGIAVYIALTDFGFKFPQSINNAKMKLKENCNCSLDSYNWEHRKPLVCFLMI